MNVKVLKPLHVKGKTIKDGVYTLEELDLDDNRAKILIEKQAIASATLSNPKQKQGEKDAKKRQ